MDLLGDVGHVESRFSAFGDSVSVECKIGARFHVKRTRASESFYTNPMVLLVTMLKCKNDLVHLEIVLILTQDRCMLYSEPTISLEVILDTPDRTPR